MTQSVFKREHAQRVVRSDETVVEFLSRDTMLYRSRGRDTILTIENVLTSDGHANGVRLVDLAASRWQTGEMLTAAEIASMIVDLRDASIPLKTHISTL